MMFLQHLAEVIKVEMAKGKKFGLARECALRGDFRREAVRGR